MLFVLAAAGVWFVRDRLAGSLPVLDGERPLDALVAPVTITRDEIGIPTIVARHRVDAAVALGFVHAQERFFQMDLQRRQAAGELAAIFGSRALPADRAMRVHRFRHIAHQALALAPSPVAGMLRAYASGVNAGLTAMSRPPFEYLLLGQDPAPWQPEDSILTVLAMFNTLQGRQAAFERSHDMLHQALPPALASFLTARGSEWDAPVVGEPSVRPPIPGPEVFNLRTNPVFRVDGASRRGGSSDPPTSSMQGGSDPPPHDPLSAEESAALGSNNWVVAGTHTVSGAALVANDMHLAINVPNIWYRAVMRVNDPGYGDPDWFLAGVTLPGLPALVVGSNGRIAWGFTNSGGDWSDLVIVEPDPHDTRRYTTPQGPRAFEEIDEVIAVAGGAPETFRVRWTMWGPIVGSGVDGRLLAQKWVAHDPQVLGAQLDGPERARSVEEALDAFTRIGMPEQNVVVGDKDGHIGWTIAGPIPRRRGFDGSRPTSWADGSRGWDGYLSAREAPRIVDPPSGRIWTANAPVVDGPMLAAIGEGGYADGIRARMIRDRLLAIDRATPADMLTVQLDDAALFHERWRTLILAALTDTAVIADPRRAELRRLVEHTWTGHASPESAGYRLVRSVRQALAREVLESVSSHARLKDSDFDFTRTLRSEGPLWPLITERPMHLLDPKYATWDDRILAAIDATIAEVTAGDRAMAEGTWGAFNRALVTHPMAGAVPLVGGWLNMPSDPLRGDIFTPRAHSPRAGPSQRMIVSPGREEDAIAHMPAGQSGHPLSPHYRDQHEAWVNGAPLPFMPGPARHTLTLVSGGPPVPEPPVSHPQPRR